MDSLYGDVYVVMRYVGPFFCFKNVLNILEEQVKIDGMRLRAIFFSILVIYTVFLELAGAGMVDVKEATGYVCPRIDMSDQSIPECPPEGSSQILPDTYPAFAIFVSYGVDPAGEAQLVDTLTGILNASHMENTAPVIVVPGLTEASKSQLMKKIPPGLWPQYKAKVVVPPAIVEKYTWQQDYFKSTFDPETGMPLVRFIRGYPATNRVRPVWFSRILDSINHGCNPPIVRRGDGIPKRINAGYKPTPGHFGGGFQGLPGGLCIHGDHQEESFVRSYCPQEKNVVIQDSWLKVGHVDEIMTVVKDRTRPAPCDYAIALASPAEALHLLAKDSTRPFVEYDSEDELVERPGDPGFTFRKFKETFCDLLQNENKDLFIDVETIKAPEIACTSNSSFPLDKSLLDYVDMHPITKKLRTFDCNLRGDKILEVFRKTSLGDYNLLIQKKMDQIEDILKDRLLSANPKCGPVKVIHLPMLFRGGEPVENSPTHRVRVKLPPSFEEKSVALSELTAEEKSKLPLHERYASLPPAKATSIFPNSVNLVSLGQTVLVPKSFNPIFDEVARKRLESLGLTVDPIKTWPALHAYDGNLHCSTNALRYCRPREGDTPSDVLDRTH